MAETQKDKIEADKDIQFLMNEMKRIEEQKKLKYNNAAN